MTGDRPRAGTTRTPGDGQRDGGDDDASPPDTVRATAGAGDEGVRADQFLARRLGISAAAARRLLATGAVRADGRRLDKGTRLTAGMTLQYPAKLPGTHARLIPDANVGLTVLHEDPHLVAIAKPAGMPSLPRSGADRGTAAGAIVARYPECGRAAADAREGGLVHRLDTDTSGVLIAARDPATWATLRAAMSSGACEKLYLAEVRGQPPAEGHLTAAIGRAGRRGGRVRLDGGRRPQDAETWFVVRGRGRDTALVEARLHTGRAHQVRAHLAGAGFPIVGDDRYGAPGDDAAGSGGGGAGLAPGLRLHALAVRLRHPATGADITIEAPPPNWAASARFPA